MDCESELMAFIATHYPLEVVSPVQGGPLCSTDPQEINLLQCGNFTHSQQVRNSAEFQRALHTIWMDRLNTKTVTAPLYHQSRPVWMGCYFCYDAATQTLSGIHLRNVQAERMFIMAVPHFS